MTPYPPLPIDAVLADISTALNCQDDVILVAPPGAGKSTRVPLALLNADWLGLRKILLLEPRRLAAKSVATQLATQLNEKPGERVGYRMRLDSCCSAATQIEVITEGILLRLLQDDPALDDTGLIIFDEFHERHLDSDLGLSLSLYSRALFREGTPLKLLLMSATLDVDAIQRVLPEAAMICSEGRCFPVDTFYQGAPLATTTRHIVGPVCQQVIQAHVKHEGSILVFLPGQAEIQQCAQLLRQHFGRDTNTRICPLYGNLDWAEQQQAIETPPAGQRKIVLATNIAETSLTIDGVTIVIDSGLCRNPAFDPNTALTRLQTQRISRSSAEQRRGRAGRTAPGVCYRLWSESSHRSLALRDSPEITRADLAPLALQLLSWGVTHGELTWIDPPNPGAYQQALQLLQQLGGVTVSGGSWSITPHGERMAALPVHPRLAHMLLKSQRFGLQESACRIAALLSERTPGKFETVDIEARLALLFDTQMFDTQMFDAQARSSGKVWRQRIRIQQQQFTTLLAKHTDNSVHKKIDDSIDHAQQTGLLLALAYPDRIARQQSTRSTSYTLSNGRQALLDENDPLRNEAWLVVAEVGGTQQRQSQLFLAAAFDPLLLDGCLSELTTQQACSGWDSKQQILLFEQRTLVGALLLSSQPLQPADPQLLQQAILDMIRDKGLSCLPWTEELRQWQNRVMLLHRQIHSKPILEPWPDVSDEFLINHLNDWLPAFIDNVRTEKQLQGIDFKAALFSQLQWPQQKLLDEMAPTHFTVPTGSTIAIDYTQQPPVLAVKLQELFGLAENPSILQGTVALQLHLLSPARRPIAITQNLAYFWQHGYHEVKKELKGRYPKHPWPEDPLTAKPMKGTKKQGG